MQPHKVAQFPHSTGDPHLQPVRLPANRPKSRWRSCEFDLDAAGPWSLYSRVSILTSPIRPRSVPILRQSTDERLSDNLSGGPSGSRTLRLSAGMCPAADDHPQQSTGCIRLRGQLRNRHHAGLQQLHALRHPVHSTGQGWLRNAVRGGADSGSLVPNPAFGLHLGEPGAGRDTRSPDA